MSLKHDALAYLEQLTIEEANKYKGRDELGDAITERVAARKSDIIEWMFTRPEAFQIIADNLCMRPEEIKECYSMPARFWKHCNETLLDYFKDSLTDFEDDIIRTLVSNGYIDKDTDAHDTDEAGGLSPR